MKTDNQIAAELLAGLEERNATRANSEASVEISGTQRASSTPKLVEAIADKDGRLSMYRFIKEIDNMIMRDVPSTHLWNYCVENRREILAKAEGNL